MQNNSINKDDSGNKNENRTYIRRWYDEDYNLSQIVEKMQYSDDDVRRKIAMLIIKIIIDKRIMDLTYENIEDLLDSLKAGYTDTKRSRWYDSNSTVRTAMQMLNDLPAEERYIIANEIIEEHKLLNIYLL